MKINFLLVLSVTLLLVSCETMDLQEDNSLSDTAITNEVGKQLLRQLKAQKGTYLLFLQTLNGNKPLFNSAIASVNAINGGYYSVPYSDMGGEIKGCIIYPINTALKNNVYLFDGELGNPQNVDIQRLDNEKSIKIRYFYSSKFLNWKQQGLSVDSSLTHFAVLLNKGGITVNKSGIMSRTGNPSIIGNVAAVTVEYECSSHGGVSNGEVYVATLNPAKIREIFEWTLPSYSMHQVHSIETTLHENGFFSLIKFESGFTGTEVLRIVKCALDEVRYYAMQHSLFFYTPIIDVTMGHEDSSGITYYTDYPIAGGGYSIPPPTAEQERWKDCSKLVAFLNEKLGEEPLGQKLLSHLNLKNLSFAFSRSIKVPAQYDGNSNNIQINTTWDGFEQQDIYKMLLILCHEEFHAYQYRNMGRDPYALYSHSSNIEAEAYYFEYKVAVGAGLLNTFDECHGPTLYLALRDYDTALTKNNRAEIDAAYKNLLDVLMNRCGYKNPGKDAYFNYKRNMDNL